MKRKTLTIEQIRNMVKSDCLKLPKVNKKVLNEWVNEGMKNICNPSKPPKPAGKVYWAGFTKGELHWLSFGFPCIFKTKKEALRIHKYIRPVRIIEVKS